MYKKFTAYGEELTDVMSGWKDPVHIASSLQISSQCTASVLYANMAWPPPVYNMTHVWNTYINVQRLH